MRSFFTLLFLGVAIIAMPQVSEAEYFFDDAAPGYGQGISVTVPANTGNVEITGEIPVSALSPGFHQLFFRVRDDVKGWSNAVSRVFLKSWPIEAATGLRYRIDAFSGGETWAYKAFSSPSTDATLNLEVDVSTLTDGVHYLEASARSENGMWSHISKGTFFIYSLEPLNINALEYYFEDESGVAGTLLTVDNFTPSPNVTLDSVTFSVPVASLVNLNKYFIYVRAVDETGNRGLFVRDTIVYHSVVTGMNGMISLTKKIIVFPNPVSDIVNLKFVNLDEAGEFIIRVIDETGRITIEDRFSFKSNDHYTVNGSSLVPGIYRIVLYTNSGKPAARATFVKK